MFKNPVYHATMMFFRLGICIDFRMLIADMFFGYIHPEIKNNHEKTSLSNYCDDIPNIGKC